MRRTIIAGNWKMNKTCSEAVDLITSLKERVGNISSLDIVVCPPYVSLREIKNIIKGSEIKLGAQNMYFELSGAYTGEISGEMLTDAGCEYTIIGHSERRMYFGETNGVVNKKVKAAFSQGLIPVICIGELLEDRVENKTFDVIKSQMIEGLKNLNTEVINSKKEFIIAYEPVWAIGTGKVATPEQAQEVHAFIRKNLALIFNENTASATRIQYGGSVKPDNMKALISQKDIDGALVGGASLKADSFSKIVEVCQ
ncbi:MAG: triose-phosphate isomerase [bacterium]|nr:triose-phosphate isomerase [bacterium]